MRLIDLFNNGAIILRCISSILQYKHTKQQHQHNQQRYQGPTGLSTTYLKLQLFTILLSITSTCFYFLPEVQDQYSLRFFNQKPPIDIPYLIIELIYCGLTILLILQQHYEFDYELLAFIVIQLVPFGYLIKLWLYNQSKIFTLDLIDYLWLLTKFNACVYLIPQIYRIWFDECSGLYKNWIWLNLGALGFEFMGNFINNNQWFEDALNFNNYWIIIVLNLLWTITIFFQTKFLKEEEEVHYKEV
ncbi:uncharacterized protein KGF55_005057 [Candida pseudojiufengensis]|uniref:uncharacterized protein n=1 Tax=Candida pseudojiufengensis TaxID=497109 RepID=UPI002224F9AD|nr:uncharacterized protein KGF55_005057 [Candida pseudojiufengensis]KAI5959825.1 hypothetical protein KGF55_005057 [Candida pseudojiufengensis]